MSSRSGAQKSMEGWIVFVTNVHEEASEEDILDAFSDFGQVQNITVNLDRRTGFAKGYALVEFRAYEEAQDAINELHGKEVLGQKVGVDWAFLKPLGEQRDRHRGRGRGDRHRNKGR